MLNSWQQLCRLCAKEDGSEIDVFLKRENGASLVQTIQKYFLITISPYEKSPTMICTTCYRSITNLVLFADYTTKVEAFFTKLMLNEFNLIDTDLNKLKFEHGLSEFVFSFPDVIQKSDQQINTIGLIHDNSVNINDEIKRTLKTRKSSSEHNTPNIGAQKRKQMQNDDDEIAVGNRPLNDHINQLEDEEDQSEEDDNICDDLCEIKMETFDTESYSEKSFLKPIEKCTKRVKKVIKIKEIDNQFQCEKCVRIFKRECSLQQHIKKFHSSDESQTYSCTKCGKVFQNKKRFQRHAIVHLPPEFVCEECGKAFKTNGALKEHKYVHVEETTFECQKCPKKFKTMVLLKMHKDSHNDTIYTCPECGLKLNTKQILRRHMVVHSDKKKFKCDYCGNEYKRAKTLKNHLIIHTGLRPYTCPFCDQTFTNGANCRSHKKKAHPAELAAMEAAGEIHLQTKIPKIAQLREAVSNLL